MNTIETTTTERACAHCGGTMPTKPKGKRGPAPEACSDECRAARVAARKAARHRETYAHKGYANQRPSAWAHKPGDRFGALVIIERENTSSGTKWVSARCDCGNVKRYNLSNLVNGVTTNCADRSKHADPRRKDVLTYDGAHNRVKAERGSASLYACATDCGRQAEQWAYFHADADELREAEGRENGRPYSTDPTHYVPLCRSCHGRLDTRHRKTYGDALSLGHVALWCVALSDGTEAVAA